MTPRLAFSTLACPQWSIETVIANARAYGYDGIEWRGGDQGHVRPTASSAELAELRQRMQDAALQSIALAGYSRFVSDDPAERAANVDILRRNLDLAAAIGAPYVRAFMGDLPPGQTRAGAYPYVIESIGSAIDHARAVNVGIAVEHHDDFIPTESILAILNALDDPHLGAVWDIANAYSVGEDPSVGIRNLNRRIMYVQLKDGTGQRPHWQQLTNVGEGVVPLSRALQLLASQNYSGAISVEWEYTWHPDLEPPERALPQALAWLRPALKQAYMPDGADM